MAKVQSIEENEETGVTNITFDLSPDEMSILIFAGMSESEYDNSLINPYDGSIKETMPDYEHFKKACADNGVSEQDGYLYIQIGIQTAIVAGINAMSRHMDELEQGDS